MPSDGAIARLAKTQHGNVATPQLRRLGFSKDAILHRRETGRLIQRYHGVYAFGYLRTDLLSRASAAYLAAGTTAAITGDSAASVFGALPDQEGPIHLVRRTSADPREGLVVHKGDPGKTWHRHDLPLTSPARTLLELAETHDEPTLTRAYNELQVLKLLTRAQLVTELKGWSGRAGVAALRRLTGEDLGPTRSPLEDDFGPLVRAARLPLPSLNDKVLGYLVDAHWREHKLIVELDSRFHDTDPKFESDRARDAHLAAHGYVVLRFTYRRVKHEPYAVIAELAAALSLRSSSLASLAA